MTLERQPYFDRSYFYIAMRGNITSSLTMRIAAAVGSVYASVTDWDIVGRP